MKFQPWITTTNSSSTGTQSISPTTSTCNNNSSIASNLSIQTLPSLPSLQHNILDLSPVTHHLLLPAIPPSLPITSLAINGKLLYAASSHLIRVFLLPDLSPVDSFQGNDPSAGSVKSFAFTGSSTVLTAHQDSKVRVWEITPSNLHRLIATLPTITDRLRNFMLPRNYVDVRRNRKCLWNEHADAVTALAVHEGSIYSVSWDRSLKVWRGSDLRCMESVRAAHQDAVNALTVGADGVVYTGSADGKIRVWKRTVGVGAGKGGKRPRHILVATLDKHKSAINALVLSEDGSLLFSGACDRSILVWGHEDSAEYLVAVGALRGHRKSILCLISAGELLISGSADQTVRVWRRGVDGGKFVCLAVMEGHEKGVKSLGAVSFENGDVLVVSGSLDGEIRLRQLHTQTYDYEQ